MNNSKLVDILHVREVSVTLDNVMQNSKASSGGDRDVDFLKYLIDNKLLVQSEVYLKRTKQDFNEEYYTERYKKMSYESDRHFYCRVIIQDELCKLGIGTLNSVDAGNMDILRSNSNYDIATEDLSALIDIGLTPARNYFRGLTELRVKNFLITPYFDDYMDDIIFSCFTRSNDEGFNNAVREYQEGYKMYAPNPQVTAENEMYYR